IRLRSCALLPMRVGKYRQIASTFVAATVSWIAFTPVKGLRLQHRLQTRLTVDGVPGDRSFFLVDQGRTMVRAAALGGRAGGARGGRAGSLALAFPDGHRLAAPVELGELEEVRFHGLGLHARPVLGPFSDALSKHCGVPLRMFASPRERPGMDRGRDGAVTL